MIRKSDCLVSMLLLLAPLASVSAQGARDDQPVRCINVSRIDRTEVIDDKTIVFHMRGGDIYINHLENTCMNLAREDRFSYRTSTRQLCAIDSISVLERSGFGIGLQRGVSCGLSEFTPADEEIVAMLKGDIEEAEITVEELEVEDE